MRPQRGSKLGSRVHALTLQQKMPQGEAWQRFLSNGDNKNYLISIFFDFLISPKSKKYYVDVNVHYFFNIVSRGFLLFLYESEKQTLFWCSLLFGESQKPLWRRVLFFMPMLSFKFYYESHIRILFAIVLPILLKSLAFRILITVKEIKHSCI